MSALIDVLVVLHLLGAAAIIGSWLANPRDPVPRPAMLWGARAQVVTGLILVALHETSSDPAEKLNMAKIGVKLVIALAVAALVEMAAGRARREASTPATGSGATRTASRVGLVQVAAVLAVVNVCVAVLWR